MGSGISRGPTTRTLPRLASPVIVADHGSGPMAGARIVALPFTPVAGYWAGPDGVKLIGACARYAAAGATSLMIEAQYAALRPTGRAAAFRLSYEMMQLQQRDQASELPSGALPLVYGGLKTTVMDRVTLPSRASWAEVLLGKGRVLFSALPLELNSNLESVAAVYGYALARAGVGSTYTTDMKDPGILICPTRLPKATLYEITSETQATTVRFRDGRSGKTLCKPSGGTRGPLAGGYRWAATDKL